MSRKAWRQRRPARHDAGEARIFDPLCVGLLLARNLAQRSPWCHLGARRYPNSQRWNFRPRNFGDDIDRRLWNDRSPDMRRNASRIAAARRPG
jgi:hypothetical protein